MAAYRFNMLAPAGQYYAQREADCRDDAEAREAARQALRAPYGLAEVWLGKRFVGCVLEDDPGEGRRRVALRTVQ